MEPRSASHSLPPEPAPSAAPGAPGAGQPEAAAGTPRTEEPTPLLVVGRREAWGHAEPWTATANRYLLEVVEAVLQRAGKNRVNLTD